MPFLLDPLHLGFIIIYEPLSFIIYEPLSLGILNISLKQLTTTSQSNDQHQLQLDRARAGSPRRIIPLDILSRDGWWLVDGGCSDG